MPEACRYIPAAFQQISSRLSEIEPGGLRFGPNKEQRVIALRDDGTILGLDGDGSPTLRVQLEDEVQPFIAAGDLDGDGRDELLISSKDRGVATVEMELP